MKKLTSLMMITLTLVSLSGCSNKTNDDLKQGVPEQQLPEDDGGFQEIPEIDEDDPLPGPDDDATPNEDTDPDQPNPNPNPNPSPRPSGPTTIKAAPHKVVPPVFKPFSSNGEGYSFNFSRTYPERLSKIFTTESGKAVVASLQNDKDAIIGAKTRLNVHAFSLSDGKILMQYEYKKAGENREFASFDAAMSGDMLYIAYTSVEKNDPRENTNLYLSKVNVSTGISYTKTISSLNSYELMHNVSLSVRGNELFLAYVKTNNDCAYPCYATQNSGGLNLIKFDVTDFKNLVEVKRISQSSIKQHIDAFQAFADGTIGIIYGEYKDIKTGNVKTGTDVNVYSTFFDGNLKSLGKTWRQNFPVNIARLSTPPYTASFQENHLLFQSEPTKLEVFVRTGKELTPLSTTNLANYASIYNSSKDFFSLQKIGNTIYSVVKNLDSAKGFHYFEFRNGAGKRLASPGPQACPNSNDKAIPSIGFYTSSNKFARIITCGSKSYFIVK